MEYKFSNGMHKSEMDPLTTPNFQQKAISSPQIYVNFKHLSWVFSWTSIWEQIIDKLLLNV